MNKIFFLKVLIGIITLLIFLTLGGIVYGLVNYKTTPKLLSGKNKSIFMKSSETTNQESVQNISLDLKKNEHIKDSHACGEMLCVRVSSDFNGERIIIFDPAALKIKAVLQTTVGKK